MKLEYTINGDRIEHDLTGKVVWVIGPNGSGKSTFCAALSIATTGAAHSFLWRDTVAQRKMLEQGGLTNVYSNVPRGRNYFEMLTSAMSDPSKTMDLWADMFQDTRHLRELDAQGKLLTSEAKRLSADGEVLKRYGCVEAARTVASAIVNNETALKNWRQQRGRIIGNITAQARVDLEVTLRRTEELGFFGPGSLCADDEGVRLHGSRSPSDSQRRRLVVAMIAALAPKDSAPIILPDVDWDPDILRDLTNCYLSVVDTLPLLVIQTTKAPPGRPPVGTQRVMCAYKAK